MDISNARGIYAITDCDKLADNELIEKTETLLSIGISLLQYRNKTNNQHEKKELAIALQALCHDYQTPFIVNDDLQLAQEINADGIHLGKDDIDIKTARQALGEKIIGISCYNDLDRAIAAEQNTADYIAFGSFFSSTTKPAAIRADIELLKQAKLQLTIPIVAIGGITPENGKQLVNAGADYLAVISGLYSTADITKTTMNYKKLFKCN